MLGAGVPPVRRLKAAAFQPRSGVRMQDAAVGENGKQKNPGGAKEPHRAQFRSNPVGRRPDAFVPEIDFSLATMMRHVNVHREQDFSPEEPSIGRVVRLVELLVSKVWDHGGAIGEGIA